MKRAAVITGLVLAVGVAGAAAAETYTCKITPAGKSHAVPTDVVIQHDASSGSVMVNDNYVQHNVGSPVAGILKSKNANRVQFTWTVRGVKHDSGQYAAGLTYSLNIQLPSGTASITGKPQGYANSWRGSGTCSVR